MRVGESANFQTEIAAHSRYVNRECDRRTLRRILWEAHLTGESCLRLQLMILLSALLASLTGFVAGERPVAAAQVELSAAAVAVEAADAAVVPLAHPRQSAIAFPRSQQVLAESAASLAPVISRRAHLDIKQSWLI